MPIQEIPLCIATPLGSHVSEGRAVLAIDCSDEKARERISAALENAVEVVT